MASFLLFIPKSCIFASSNFFKMAKIRGATVVENERCKGCNLCVTACPFDVLETGTGLNSRGYNFVVVKNPDSCTGCASCGYVCPDGCITVYKVKE
jgi:2-oxoglutarate ferredoxin oxidoreductase subunit delta